MRNGKGIIVFNIYHLAFSILFMTKKTFFIVILIVVIILGIRFIFGGSEDTWICVNGEWVKHGVPSAPMLDEPCDSGDSRTGDDKQQMAGAKKAVRDFVEENIADLSPIEPVLGGSWYVLDIEFLDDDKVRVAYEDGHIMSEFEANYRIVNKDGDIELSEIELVGREH